MGIFFRLDGSSGPMWSSETCLFIGPRSDHASSRLCWLTRRNNRVAMTVLGTSQPLRVMRSGQGRTIIGQRCNRMCVLGISNGKSAQTYPGNSTFKKCQNSNIQTDVSNFTISFFVMLDTKCSPYISFEHLNSKFWHRKNKPLLTLDFGRFPPLKITQTPKPKPLGILI